MFLENDYFIDENRRGGLPNEFKKPFSSVNFQKKKTEQKKTHSILGDLSRGP